MQYCCNDLCVVCSVAKKKNTSPNMNQLRLMALVLLYLLSCSHVMAQINPTPKFAVTPTGHGSYDAGRAVTYDASGNMYVAGYFSGEFNADNTTATNTYYLKAVGNKDIYVAKYNASGNPVWAFGAGGANDDEAAAISVDAAGNVYIAGYTNGNNTTTFDANPAAATNNITRQSITVSNDMFVAKYDGTQLPSSASFYQWAFITGDVGDDKVNAMALDPAGKLYVGGYITGTTSTMIDADPGTGTYNVTGATATNNTDLFMACYDVTQTLNSGSFLSWAHTAGNIGQDNVNDIKLSGGYLYATGQVNISNAATVDMDPSSNTATVTGTTASQTVEGFVAKYDASVASGNASFYKWAFLFGGNNSQYGYKLDVDANGFVYLADISCRMRP